MPNGLGFKGGEASDLYRRVPAELKKTVVTRQIRRHETRTAEFQRLQQEFGGFSGGYHFWPEGMNRKIARQIAMDKAHGIS